MLRICLLCIAILVLTCAVDRVEERASAASAGARTQPASRPAGTFEKLEEGPEPDKGKDRQRWKTATSLGYEPWKYIAADGRELLFRLKLPPDYDPNGRYPLVIALSGVGGRGKDNLQVDNCEAAKALAAEAVQKKHPAIIFAPQCPKEFRWVETSWAKPSYAYSETPVSKPMALVLEIIPQLTDRYAVDARRIYAAGQSMGGWGTWDLITRKPEWFAAAVPVCGGGDPTQAKRIRHISIWNFHGDKDGAVPVAASRKMIEALKAVGGSPKYTEYPGGPHWVWLKAWKEPELVDWLYKQRLSAPPRLE